MSSRCSAGWPSARPITLEAAPPGAEPAVLHLVDCTLLVPPRVGPGWPGRYVLLETLRAYELDRLTETGKQPEAAAALAGHALRRQENPGPGLAPAPALVRPSNGPKEYKEGGSR